MRFVLLAALLLVSTGFAAEEITNSASLVRAVRGGAGWVGFDLFAWQADRLVPVAEVRWISGARWTAARCEAAGGELRFSGFATPGTATPALGAGSRVTVRLGRDDPFPQVRFTLDLSAFDESVWRRAWTDLCPVYFLRCSLPAECGAEQMFYQGGELYPGPDIDPFPITQAPMRGHWADRWSYSVAVGAHPVPAFGLWAPGARRFVAYEFEDARTTDRSDRDLASTYCAGVAEHPGQFAALSYPHGAHWLTLRLPAAPVTLDSRFRMLYSLDMPSDSDPNRFVIRELVKTYLDRLPPAPRMNDMSWLKQGPEASQVRFLADLGLAKSYPREHVAPMLYSTWDHCEKVFFSPGSTQLAGHQTGKGCRYAWGVGDQAGLADQKKQLDYLVAKAKTERFGDDVCYVWEHPLEGSFNANFGGQPATGTRHMFNWAIASAMLWWYKEGHAAEYLPYVDGMVRWTRHYLYDRAGMADLPWAVFSMGAGNGGEFLLDYAYTFRDDPERKALAAEALRLADVVVYRNLYPYLADPDGDDTLDPSFLLQAVNSNYWFGQVTWGEMGRVPEMAIQMYLETGDPFYRYLVRGCLEQFYVGTISSDGRYTENLSIYGETGKKGSTSGGWGGNNFRWLAEPLGGALVQVDCGPRAAMAFCRGTQAVDITDYAFAPEASYGFRLTVDPALPGAPAGAFDVQVTSPRRSLAGAAVKVNGQALPADRYMIGSDGTNALIRGVRAGDRVSIGTAEPRPLPFPAPLRTRQAWDPIADPGFAQVDLRKQATAAVDNLWSGPWGGLVPGPKAAAHVPFALVDPQANGGRGAVPLDPAATLRPGGKGPAVVVLGAPGPLPDGPVAMAVVRYAGGREETVALAAESGIEVRHGMEWYAKEWWQRAFALGAPGQAIESLRLEGKPLLFALSVAVSKGGESAIAALRGDVEAVRLAALRERQRVTYQRFLAPTEQAQLDAPWSERERRHRLLLHIDPRDVPRSGGIIKAKVALDALLAQVGLSGHVDPASVRAVALRGDGGPRQAVAGQFCPDPALPDRGELLLRPPFELAGPEWFAVYFGLQGEGSPAAAAPAQLKYQLEGSLAQFGNGKVALEFELAGAGGGPRLMKLAWAGGPNQLGEGGWDAGYGHLCACQDGVTWYDFGALQATDATAEVIDRGELAMTVRVSGLEIYGQGRKVAFQGVGTAGERQAEKKGTAEWYFRLYADDPRVDSWVTYTIQDPGTAWSRPLEARFATADKVDGRSGDPDKDGAAFAMLGKLALVGLDDQEGAAARPSFTGQDGAVLSVGFDRVSLPGTFRTDSFRILPLAADAALAAEAAPYGVDAYAVESLVDGKPVRTKPEPIRLGELTGEVDWTKVLPFARRFLFTPGQPDHAEGLRSRDNPDEGVSRRGERAGKPVVLAAEAGQGFFYFDLDEAVKLPDAGGKAYVAVEYFDRGHGGAVLQYDSADPAVHITPAPGAFKEAAGSIKCTNSGTWRVYVFSLDDALFHNRCNGSDFRLEVSGGELWFGRVAVGVPEQ
ncbi:MAG: hypothetical protein HYU66_14415 [Armatimonadetes bacterium]|nr:hypothetical protein [Armatimonadota bacterium]